MQLVSRSIRHALSACATVSIVAGCASPQTQVGGLPNAGPVGSAAHERSTNGSWIAPGVKSKALLYVSDTGRGRVNVYSWPSLELVGTLRGFTQPYAMCVDGAQDVYVTDYGAMDIVKYAHGGTTPIATLSDPYGFPTACSVDPANGNLAVANYESRSRGPGNVVIYSGGSAKHRKEYEASNLFYYYYFPAYVPTGALYVDGQGTSGGLQLARLAKFGANFRTINANQAFVSPGGVAWDGEHLAIADRSVNVIYQFTVVRKRAKEVGATALAGASNVYQFSVTGATASDKQGTKVVGADIGGRAVYVWAYPAGGSPIKTIDGLKHPAGVAVSAGTK